MIVDLIFFAVVVIFVAVVSYKLGHEHGMDRCYENLVRMLYRAKIGDPMSKHHMEERLLTDGKRFQEDAVLPRNKRKCK